ncbi:MAG: ABC transporter substrate-binding protein [Xanthobacteraceae bacterium]|nr:ABC transporter substrate-binding protein [Xanthobacteraceae bacterium]
MRRFKTVLGALMALALTSASGAQAQEKFKFALNWFPVGDHTAYWVALDKGYYAKAGLDVTLENSKGSGDSIAKVDTGRADAGLADAAVIIAAVSRGAKIKTVGMVFDKTPLNVFSRPDMPIRKPKDLEGHTIAAPPGDGQRQIWPAFAKLHGIDMDKVTWVNVEPSAKVAAVSEKRVDAVGDYLTGQPNYDKAMGGPGTAVMMPWADFGFDMYSMSIMASEDTMKNRPKALRAFLEASYQGWRDVMADPEAAIAIYKKRVPEINLDYIRANTKLGLSLMNTERYRQHGIGWMDPKKMCASVDLVNTYMGLKKTVACDDVYTNDFLTKVSVPDNFK